MQFFLDTISRPDVSQPAAWVLRCDALPELLSRYYGVPTRSTFSRDAFGRPTLPGISLDFSTSHCDGFTAVAITSAGRVGIDIERKAPDDWQSVARECCTNEELVWLNSDRDFLRLWTAKEACGKALGLGTNLDLRGIEFGVQASACTGWNRQDKLKLELRTIQHSAALARGWQLFQREHQGLIISVALAR